MKHGRFLFRFLSLRGRILFRMKHTQEYFRDFFLFYGIASGLEAAQIFLDCLDVLWQQLSGIILVKGAR